MSEKLIPLENLSNEVLKATLEEAGFPCELLDNDWIKLTQEKRIYLQISKEAWTIQIFSGFSFKKEVSLEDRLRLTNNLNRAYVMVKAHVRTHEPGLWLEFHVPMRSGLRVPYLLLSLKTFISVVRTALEKSAATLDLTR